ncbi:SGNH hydrolase domain-containing protein [Herbiconiux sp. A18JL235]|uniref:SGNH hydrolase domain-containing protein n=1 Tax=Herbiconiux sp. A18JL235 TaxID=3152363 RepID=A0AB39BIX5_9MICO
MGVQCDTTLTSAIADESCADQALYPNLATSKIDNGIGYNCYNDSPEDGLLGTCSYGSERPDALRLAVTGDSHGAVLVNVLVAVADEENWHIDTYVSRGCTWAASWFEPETDCADYRESLQAALEEEEYDAVITTVRRRLDMPMASDLDFAKARAEVWTSIIDPGAEVITVIDNPLVPEPMADCVIQHPREALRAERCVVPRGVALSEFDTSHAAADLEPRARVLDLTDLYCDDDGCPMVIGNVIVYRDRHHITGTYAATASPFIADRLRASLTRRE